jgi:hypothetical protein
MASVCADRLYPDGRLDEESHPLPLQSIIAGFMKWNLESHHPNHERWQVLERPKCILPDLCLHESVHQNYSIEPSVEFQRGRF